MAKYNFSITTLNGEKLEVVNCDSFDEAIEKVERGVKDRAAQLLARSNKPAEEPKAMAAKEPELGSKLPGQQDLPIETHTENGAARSAAQPI